MSNITILRLISIFYQVNRIHFLNQEANLKNIFYIITKRESIWYTSRYGLFINLLRFRYDRVYVILVTTAFQSSRLHTDLLKHRGATLNMMETTSGASGKRAN